jgi:hypothetical protein
LTSHPGIKPRKRYLDHPSELSIKVEEYKELNNVWNEAMEDTFINLYMDEKTFDEMVAHFQKTYPQYAYLFSTLVFRSKLLRLLRMALRKLYNYYYKHSKELPELRKLNNRELKAVMYGEEAFKIRGLLLRIYLSMSFHIKLIIYTIREMLSYVVRLEFDAKIGCLVPKAKS